MKKNDFDVFKIALENTNLVEASAGTGKTFSIAILTLRLIIEKKIDLSKILMVTFTKAAVAELESRIRIFIKDAYQYINEESNDLEKAIKVIIDKEVKKEGKAKIKDRIKGAQFQLDEISIFTIHSFCQKVLTEFAFETNQLFSNEIKSQISLQTNKYIDQYWRKNISCLPTKNIEILTEIGLKKDDLHNIIKIGLGEKKFLYNHDIESDKILKNIDKNKQLRKKQLNYFKTIFETSDEKNSINKSSQKTFGSLIDQPEDFMHLLIKKQSTQYVPKEYPTLLQIALKYEELEDSYKKLGHKLLRKIYGEAIEFVRNQTNKYKKKTGTLVFDDLISNLHKAVKGKQSDLLKYELQKKYKAVFVDEFQDTDNLQYQIFDTLFGKSSIVFYIGDPKQAIYGFRGADIETYKSASIALSQMYTMKHNFRSTPMLIKAMNHFFGIENPFLDSMILYEDVKSGKKIPPPIINDKALPPLTLIKCKNKTEITKQVSYRILHILQSNIQINNKNIIPSDICVLVRKKSEGKDMQKALQKLRIPSVINDDTKVTETNEASYIQYLLSALISPTPSNIKRLLISPLVNYKKEYLTNSLLDNETQTIKIIYQTYLQKGIYSCINQFFKAFNCKEVLFKEQAQAERSYTNILQLQELLHKKETEEKLSIEALLKWLKSSDISVEDEYTQRIESDEDAVQIVTIHKSKGLAYKIVMAPFLDLKVSTTKTNLIEYKDTNQESVFSLFPTEEELYLYQLQNQQENKRLIYVALTRAIYANYIFENTFGGFKDSDLKHFISTFNNNPYSESLELLEEPNTLFYQNKEKNQYLTRNFHRKITKQWENTSYSKLSNKHLQVETEQGKFKNSYDLFIFEQLGKGALLGNFLHDIFENIDFQNNEHQDIIDNVSNKYPRIYHPELKENYKKLIHNTLKADYGGFNLKEISLDNRLSELEFYYQIPDNKSEDINKLSSLINIDKRKIKSGVMYGFIDLFFKHNNQYFILDWKSNFLGNSIKNYTDNQLDKAMLGNNYHLQYLIYTIAIKRFLEQKIQNFNYERDFGGVYYVFIRGCREQKKSGIFYKKPEYSLIEKLDRLLLFNHQNTPSLSPFPKNGKTR